MNRKAFEGAQKRERISRTFHLEMGQIAPLQKASKDMGVSQSEVVRRSLNFFIERLNRHLRKESQKREDA